MTQPGETDGFMVEDHLRALLAHSPALKLDYVIVNSAPIHAELREKYLADGAVQVDFTHDSLCDGEIPVKLRIGQEPEARSILVLCDNLEIGRASCRERV